MAGECGMRVTGEQDKYLKMIDEVNRSGVFKPSWDSLCGARRPAWFDERRLGIFIHWGVYSVPAFLNEWYPRTMYMQGTKEFLHHVRTYGSHGSRPRYYRIR